MQVLTAYPVNGLAGFAGLDRAAVNARLDVLFAQLGGESRRVTDADALFARARALSAAVINTQGPTIPDSIVSQIAALERDVWWKTQMFPGTSLSTRMNVTFGGVGLIVLGAVGFYFWRNR